MTWNETTKDLWQNLENFDFDGQSVKVSFVEKLAKDNDWPLDFALSVLGEYKRFLFLSTVADHIICPSEAVDRAWHLHLTYTDSYWNRLCDGILKKKLGHNPSTGSDEDEEKYRALYNRTLETYKLWFEEDAPAYFWPEADIRFGKSAGFKRVDLSRSWVLPKQPSFAIATSVLGLFFVLMTMGASDGMGPCVVIGVIAIIIVGSVVGGGNGFGSSGGGCGGGSGCGG
ncbi:MAG: hypothetical protein P1V97_33160 [Planctomycetota bacterium]|nr:hypothetical protein [Planctomycetota bacterium]